MRLAGRKELFTEIDDLLPPGMLLPNLVVAGLQSFLPVMRAAPRVSFSLSIRVPPFFCITQTGFSLRFTIVNILQFGLFNTFFEKEKETSSINS